MFKFITLQMSNISFGYFCQANPATQHLTDISNQFNTMSIIITLGRPISGSICSLK